MKYKRVNEAVDFLLIADVLCVYFDIDDKLKIFTPTRKKEIIRHRQWFHYFARILNPEHAVSAASIGSYCSNVTGHSYSHATILHSVRKIKGYLDYSKHDREIKLDIMQMIKQKLYNHSTLKSTGLCNTEPIKIFRYKENNKKIICFN